MIDLKIGSREMKIATEWYDVTFAQLILLYQHASAIKSDLAMLFTVLSSKTNEPIGDENTPESLYWCWVHADFNSVMKKVVPLTAFALLEYNWDAVAVPKTISFDDQEIKVSLQLDMCSFGQKVVAGQALKNYKGRIANDSLAEVVAIYLQPVIDKGKFDVDRIDEIKLKVLSMPARIVYPLAAFFLHNWKASKQNTQKIAALRSRLNKSKRSRKR